ncbi:MULTISPECIES: ABC transporter ATP-binding protein [Clostridium]|uniref:ATP-binding cassette, subfamily B n=1 Tax=Clostridium cadaveris TaxID=1529 RepID=A0A1I2JNQ3_9CLOT|nr:ABC transporter ATP-binding protein [Clostridium cadaveris]MDU4953613.1 ABC transporter ATP-binding protein [Clostridium sp.]MDM8312684.1 ABC transporter ATP-binding protein [Clostridium cadaveris]MDY4948104.1 ABC transporter ATP-binding protein [Clostridium cadaveris]NME66150.1 ABC transporter ATP-binding protein [Clostridium cadaveris]NWK11106.1 ABC transporter ATP-binding protein [Clostridium cadaveris]
MLKKFVNFYKPYKKLFVFDLIAAFLAAAIDLVYPMMTRELMDKSIPNRDIRMIGVFAATLIILFLIKALCGYFMQYWGHVVGVRMQGDMRRKVFNHLQRLPNKFFDNTKTGDVMSRIINDLMDISELAHHGPEDLFISGVMLVGSFIILCTINVPLTLIIFAFIPIIVIFTMNKRKKMKKAFLETKVETGKVNANLENSIAGIRVSKAFVSHSYEEEKFEQGNKSFMAAREKAYKVMAEYFAGANLSLDILNYVVLIFGGLFTFNGAISMGEYVAYLLYIKIFMDPIKKLINFMEQFQNGMTGFQRYVEILNEDREKEKKGAKPIKDIKGKITFKNASFSYEDNQILDNLSLEIEEGKMLALVGPSGGGKTTFCNLIPRFYDLNKGDILIDDKSIYDVTLESLRANIGIVQQEVFLFTGTIKENIRYGNLDASDEEIVEAAKRANIHDFIMELEDGYDTYIGERGTKLSGGQKQRISIARVFLKNPRILILDEATSALDNTTEYYIKQSIDELCKGRTTIVVAHRLSTIRNADEIIVLTDKGIEERGTHDELMALNGIYKDLHRFVSR